MLILIQICMSFVTLYGLFSAYVAERFVAFVVVVVLFLARKKIGPYNNMFNPINFVLKYILDTLDSHKLTIM